MGLKKNTEQLLARGGTSDKIINDFKNKIKKHVEFSVSIL